ncbi:MAG: hypothetical protein GEU88_19100 [Solirubrobacterales bacterium]|nr:hypothetical protein [Solirubrobacterales bacterium]
MLSLVGGARSGEWMEMALEVGQTLREARIGRGIELDEVERATKIRARFLRAMEEERWEALPGAAYARGFLATYARYLELDEGALVAEYRRLHDRDAEAQPIPDEMLPERGVIRKPLIRSRTALIAGAVAAVTVVAVLLAVALGGSDDGEGGSGGPSPTRAGAAKTTTRTTTERSTPEPDRASVLLRSTGTVWVCLLGEDNEALVDGETLTVDQARGPFRARSFEVTFGNGAVEMEVDGEPVDIPDAAEPIGYEVTPRGVSELEASAQPTCI